MPSVKAHELESWKSEDGVRLSVRHGNDEGLKHTSQNTHTKYYSVQSFAKLALTQDGTQDLASSRVFHNLV